MIRKLLRMFVATFLLGAALGGAGLVSAAASPSAQGLALYNAIIASPDPSAAYAQLGAVQQDLVRLVLTFDHAQAVFSVARSMATTQTAGGCWYAQKGIQGKSAAGVVLWQWNVKVDWRSDGQKITSKSANEWPSNVAITWGYDNAGWPRLSPSGGVGQSSYTMWAQAHFQWCPLPLVGCVQNQYPWASVTGFAVGTYSADAGS